MTLNARKLKALEAEIAEGSSVEILRECLVEHLSAKGAPENFRKRAGLPHATLNKFLHGVTPATKHKSVFLQELGYEIRLAPITPKGQK